MSNLLKLSHSLHLPAELAGRRTAVFGISGSGKSNTAAVIVEQLLEHGEQVVMIDPKGEGWGLLSKASGKPSNLPLIVFGEPNGHIMSLNETHGPRLADFVIETGQSVVLSLLGFESDQSERRFVATFLRQLYRRKSQRGQPSRTLIVIDEAHLFIPETSKGDTAELAGAVQRIVRQGRSFGLGTLLVDQRPQDVSKRAITQCDTLICHQLTHKLDRDALRDWIRGYDRDKQGDTFLESLAMLEPGEAWIWSPAWLKKFERVKIDRRKTFDSGAAPDGDQAVKVQRAEVDLDTLQTQLEEIVEKAKADDPKELRKQIAELKKQLQDRPAAEAKVEIKQVLLDDDITKLEKATKGFVSAVNDFNDLVLTGKETAQLLNQTVNTAIGQRSRVRGEAANKIIIDDAVNCHIPIEETPVVATITEGLTSPQQAIINVLAAVRRLGINSADRVRVAYLASTTPDSSAYMKNISWLYKTKLIEYPSDGCLRVTNEGMTKARPSDAVITNAVLHGSMLKRLSLPRGNLVRVLIKNYPSQLSREELAATAGTTVSSSAFMKNVSALRSLGLLTYPVDNTVIGTELLFVWRIE